MTGDVRVSHNTHDCSSGVNGSDRVSMLHNTVSGYHVSADTHEDLTFPATYLLHIRLPKANRWLGMDVQQDYEAPSYFRESDVLSYTETHVHLPALKASMSTNSHEFATSRSSCS